jgi:hypothetical protein
MSTAYDQPKTPTARNSNKIVRTRGCFIEYKIPSHACSPAEDLNFPRENRQTHHHQTRNHGDKAKAVQEKAHRHADGAYHQASDGWADDARTIHDRAVK